MRAFITIVFFLLINISFSQNNCEKFKTGKFQNIEEGVLRATIERDDSIQTERYGAKEVKLKIEWLDTCTYRLKFIEGNQAFWDGRPENMPTEDLIVRIIDINGNSYTQESKFESEDDFTYKSEIEKIDR